MMNFVYTNEMLKFLKHGFKTLTLSQLTKKFNEKFNTHKKNSALQGVLTRKGYSSGIPGTFQKGNIPWNKSHKGYMGANKTSYKKGNLPHNHKPLYSERAGKGGYIEISVPETNPRTGFYSRYRKKHAWLWEQEHGKIPSGHIVSFKDRDKTNFDLDNLTLLSRAELLWLNRNGYSQLSALEARESMRILAKLVCKTNELRRRE